MRKKHLLTGLVVIVLVVGLHLTTPLVPGLPEMSDSERLTAFMIALWGVEAAVIGATIVALFFALSSVQHSQPTKAGLSALFRDLRLELVLGLLLGVLLGSGLSVLLLQPANWNWPLDSPSLESLPLLSFSLFVLSMLSLFWLVWKATEYLHPSAAQDLTLKEAERLAVVVGRHERRMEARQRQEIQQIFTSSGNRGSSPGPQTQRIQRDPPERGELIELFDEAHERAVKAIEADDMPALQDALSVSTATLRGYIDCSDKQKATHKLDASESRPFEGKFNRGLCLERVSRDTISLMEIAAQRPKHRCSLQMVWYPFSIWRLGLKQDNHEATVLGLELVAYSYWQISSATDSVLVDQWRAIWREGIFGPESFIKQEARTAIRPEGTELDRVLHYLLSSLEVQDTLFLVSALALYKNDVDISGELIASHMDIHNVFWIIEDPVWRFPDEAKQGLNAYNRAIREGLALLIGLAAVRVENEENAGTKSRLLPFMLEAAERDFESLEELAGICLVDDALGPSWYDFYGGLTDYPQYAKDAQFAYVYPQHLRIWAFILVLTRLKVTRTEILSLRPLRQNVRQALDEVLRRIAANKTLWQAFVKPSLFASLKSLLK